MESKESLTGMYIALFDRLPPLLETRDYEEDFYQDLMLDAILNEQPITEETIDKALKEGNNSQYDFVDNNERNKQDQPQEETQEQDMDANKIRKLLKEYGARDVEIENFMQDLGEVKQEIQAPDTDEKPFNYLDHVDKLKLTEEGKDLIEKAPEMAKDELERAVKQYLTKNK